MLGRRVAALAQLEDPGRLLWIEWRAPPDCDVTDPEVWRQACPYTDEQIERDLTDAFAAAVASRRSDPTAPDPVDGFAVQRLNMWRDPVEPVRQRGEPVPTSTRWARVRAGRTPARPADVVVEDYFGAGVCVAVAGRLDDGRMYP